MQPTHRFHAASVTKMYMAAAVLLLAEDGAIDLDAPISRYLPQRQVERIPNGTRATVRQLLGHRSGIPDFSGDFRYDLDFLNDPFGSYPPDRLLSYLERQSPWMQPGEGYFYSNANYYILALIVDRIAGEGHAAVMDDRILGPLGLRATYYRNDPSYPTPPGLVASYRDLAGDGRLVNVTDMMVHGASVFMGNAGLIATSSDFADFIDGLLGGALLSPESISDMESWVEPSRYGLGLNYLETPYGPAIGHSGGGYRGSGAGPALSRCRRDPRPARQRRGQRCHRSAVRASVERGDGCHPRRAVRTADGSQACPIHMRTVAPRGRPSPPGGPARAT